MAQVHGKLSSIKVATNDISAFCNSIELKQSADSHDSTTFGATGHTYYGGLTDGTCSVKGLYDNTVSTGPRGSVQTKLGQTVAIVYGPEGSTTGKPLLTFNAVVTAYEESAAVADMVMFNAEFQISGAVTPSVAV